MPPQMRMGQHIQRGEDAHPHRGAVTESASGGNIALQGHFHAEPPAFSTTEKQVRRLPEAFAFASQELRPQKPQYSQAPSWMP